MTRKALALAFLGSTTPVVAAVSIGRIAAVAVISTAIAAVKVVRA